MKINYDCMRDVLIFLENNLLYNDELTPNEIELNDLQSAAEVNYSIQDIAYSSIMLDEAGFVNLHVSSDDGETIMNIIYSSITYEGHQYLDKIRSDKVWAKTKGLLGKIGAASIDIIAKVASNIILEMVNQPNQLLNISVVPSP